MTAPARRDRAKPARRPRLFEPLEARRHLAGEPWGSNPRLIRQDEAADVFPAVTGAGQTIAIVDTGIDYTVVVFGGGFGPSHKVIGGHDFADDDDDPRDTDGHGTAVAAVAAAPEFVAGGFRYRGIAPDAKLVALRIARTTESTPLERIEEALDWVLDNARRFGITVVNVSFGFERFRQPYRDDLLDDELVELADRGITVVASSGNEGADDGPGITYPAAHPTVLGIGAVDATDVIAEFSQRGEPLGLLAPGVEVQVPFDNSTASVTGTSFSAPMVAGAVALLNQVDPGLGERDVRSILRASAAVNADGDDEFGETTGLSYARLDLFAALRTATLRKAATPGELATVGATASDQSIAFDARGVLHWAYYDGAAKTLKYVTRSAEGLLSAPTTIDTGSADSGQFVSVGVDDWGRPNVAYFDAFNGDLKFARLVRGNWQTTTVDSRGSTGLYPSLVVDADRDRVHVAYFRKVSGDAMLATLADDEWTVTSVETKDDVGRYPSLALDAAGRPAVAYESTTSGKLRFARRDDQLAWHRETADTRTRGLAFTSLALDRDGRPHVSYYDASPADLKYATRDDGGAWRSEAVATRGPVGLYTSLDLEGGRRPRIVYYDRRSDALTRAVLDDGVWYTDQARPAGGKFVAAATDPTEEDDRYVVASDAATGRLRLDLLPPRPSSVVI